MLNILYLTRSVDLLYFQSHAVIIQKTQVINTRLSLLEICLNDAASGPDYPEATVGETRDQDIYRNLADSILLVLPVKFSCTDIIGPKKC